MSRVMVGHPAFCEVQRWAQRVAEFAKVRTGANVTMADVVVRLDLSSPPEAWIAEVRMEGESVSLRKVAPVLAPSALRDYLAETLDLARMVRRAVFEADPAHRRAVLDDLTQGEEEPDSIDVDALSDFEVAEMLSDFMLDPADPVGTASHCEFLRK